MTSVFNGLDRAGSAGYASRAPRQNFQHQFGGLNFGTHSAVIRDAQQRGAFGVRHFNRQGLSVFCGPHAARSSVDGG